MIRKLIFSAAIAATACTDAAEIDNRAIDSVLSYGLATETDVSMQGELELVPGLELTLAQHASLIASARVRLDAYDELEPGKPSYDT